MPPPAADLKHLSTYGAKANQLKSEVAKQARQKKEKAKVVMDTQKQVEALKIRADQEQRLSEEIHEVRLLQQNVRKYEQDRSKAKERAVVQAQREAKEYRRLAHEKNLRQEVAKQKALRERQDAEQVASTYRSEMTARETEKRRQRREYRQALDAQVDLKQAGRNSTSHLSPTERGMNRRMLANMVSRVWWWRGWWWRRVFNGSMCPMCSKFLTFFLCSFAVVLLVCFCSIVPIYHL